MKKKSIFFENSFKLTDEKMKTIVGGTVPPGGGGKCVFRNTPCGGNGGCISEWWETECCCSVDSGNSQCFV